MDPRCRVTAVLTWAMRVSRPRSANSSGRQLMTNAPRLSSNTGGLITSTSARAVGSKRITGLGRELIVSGAFGTAGRLERGGRARLAGLVATAESRDHHAEQGADPFGVVHLGRALQFGQHRPEIGRGRRAADDLNLAVDPAGDFFLLHHQLFFELLAGAKS